MKLMEITGIPAGIVNNHNEVLYYWVESGIRNATLFRVDAHHDMADYCEYKGDLTPRSYKQFDIADFNCPAVYHQIIDSIYWQNPHSKKKKLQDLGTTREDKGGRKLGVILEADGPNRLYYFWTDRRLYRREGVGKIISPQSIKVPKGSLFITDFDLDGFCCHQTDSIHSLSEEFHSYDGISDFERRIAETADLLKHLQKPSLITVARSLGSTPNDNNSKCYVPHKMADQVQECLIENLRKIYSK